jgi:Mrp family chromosome partitioning ATPase
MIINNPMNTIGKVIGVMSGKGGVGKSTVTVLLAKQLKAQGFKVGIMDADITGPSIPRLMGIKDEKAYGTETQITPVVTKDDIPVISLNLMMEDENQPVIWRGPLVANLVKQFWTDVIWNELDYLIIDMPPGTGDVALTVMQSIPLNGIVMVSVPQDMVAMIVTKAVHMVRKMNIPIIGLVENMSYIECPDCGKKITWNENKTSEYLKELDVKLLGELPMISSINNLSSNDVNEVEERVQEMVKGILGEMSKQLV